MWGRLGAAVRPQLWRGRRRVSGQLSQVVALCMLLSQGHAGPDAGNGGPAARFYVGLGHTSSVHALALGPRGRLLVTGDSRGVVKLWDVGLAREVGTFGGHAGQQLCAALSSAGDLVASGGVDGSIHVWRVPSGRLLRVLETGRGWVRSLAFEPAGRTLAAATGAEAVRLWDLHSGAETGVLRGPSEGGAAFVAFARDGERLGAAWHGADRCEWTVFDVGTGRVLQRQALDLGEWRGRPARARVFGCSADLALVACGTSFGRLRVWNAATGLELRTFRHGGGLEAVVVGADGERVISAGDRSVLVWTLAAGKPLKSLKCPGGGARAVALSSDGSRLASWGRGNALRVWETRAWAVCGEFRGPQPHAGALAARGTVLATGHETGHVALWDLRSGRLARVLGGSRGRIAAVALSPDGRVVVSSGNGGVLAAWEARTGRQLWARKEGPSRLAFSPDGARLAGARAGRGVKVWTVSGGKELWAFRRERVFTEGVCFSADGATVAATFSDRAVRLLSAATGAVAREVGEVTDRPTAVSCGPKGRLLAVGGRHGLEVRAAATGQLLRRLPGHDGLVTTVAFSTDGTRMATSSLDGTLRLWDPAGGRELRTLRPQGGADWTVAFADRNRLLVAGCGDGTVRVWESATGALLASIALVGSEDYLTWTPEGYFVGTAGALKLAGIRAGGRVSPLGRNSAVLNRPDLVSARLRGASVPKPRIEVDLGP